tara:strand:- start:39163 stop:42183 length:3021 start_codon:yes stop_codon:yes gene_type:complete
MYEIPVVGGGPEFVTVFNAIAAWTGGGGYRSFLQVVMVLSFGYALITLAFNLNYKAFFRWFLQILCVYLLLMVPTVTVRVDDKTVTSPVGGPQVVANVPIGLGALASLTTEAGFWLTRTAETLFSVTPERNYYENGYIFGAKMFQRSNGFSVTDPKARQNVINFTKQCVLQSMALGYNSYNSVVNEVDLVTAYQNLNYGALGVEITPRLLNDSQFMDCDAALQEISLQMTTETDAESRLFAEQLYTNIDNVSQRYPKYLNDFPIHSQSFLGNGPQNNTLVYLRQVSMVKMFNEAWAGYSDANRDAYAIIRSDLQARNTYASIANQAMTWVPVLYIVLSIVYFAMFPIIFPLFLLPSTGVAALRGYAAGFFYLAAWGPLYAIIHMFIMARADSNYQTIPSDGLTLANYDQVLTVGDDLSSMAGFLLLSVPVLAAALAKGAMNVAGHSAALLRPAQGAAEIAATESTTGNYAFGNVQNQNLTSSMVQANKFDTQSRTAFGSSVAQFHQPDGSVKSTFENGTASFDSSPALGRLPFTVNTRSSLLASIGQKREQAESRLDSLQRSHSRTSGSQSTSGTASRNVNTVSSGREVSTGKVSGESEDRSRGATVSATTNSSKSVRTNKGVDTTNRETSSNIQDDAYSTTGSLGIDGNVKGSGSTGDGGDGLGGSIGASGSKRWNWTDSETERQDSSKSASTSKGFNVGNEISKGTNTNRSRGKQTTQFSRDENSDRSYNRNDNSRSNETFSQNSQTDSDQREVAIRQAKERVDRLARYEDQVRSSGFDVQGDISQPVASLYEEYRASNPGEYLPSATATNVSAEENALRAAKLQDIARDYVGGFVEQDLATDATAFDNELNLAGPPPDLGQRTVVAGGPSFSQSSREAGTTAITPLPAMTVTPGGQFGGSRGHNGVDLRASIGTPVRVPKSGKVIASWNGGDGGQQMRVQLDDGSIHGFAHLSDRNFRRGQRVNQGDVIGATGNSGLHTSGPHLHYTVEVDGEKINPLDYHRG